MKKFFVMLMVAIAAISCEKEDPIVPAIVFDKAGQEIYIETEGTNGMELSFNSNVSWKAAVQGADWVVVSPKEGLAGDAVIRIIADENKTKENRSAKLVITAAESATAAQVAVAEATLVQYQVDAFELVDTLATFGEEGGTASIKVMTNVDFKVTIPADAKWLTAVGTKAYGEKVYEIKVDAFSELDASRSAEVTVSAEGFEDVTYTISQSGPKSLIWSKNVTELDGYTVGGETKIAAYGDKLLVSNLTKVLVLNPTTGAVESTVALPEGFTCDNLCVDEGGNILIAAHADYSWSGAEFCEVLTIYTLKDLSSTPKELVKYSTANIWCSNTGNIRVKGNIDTKAVITAIAANSCYWVAWEAANGEVAVDENGWSVFKCNTTPYVGTEARFGCVLPEGDEFADGLWFIAYGGDYNLKYCADPSQNAWETSYVTGMSGWMENFNCISRATWKGKEYAAITASCHFNYDATDVFVLDVTNKTAAEKVFAVDCDGLVDRDADWANLDWTGAGASSDVLLVPTDDALLVYFVDVNFNIIGCSQYK